MSSTEQHSSALDEELARAELYGLLSTLFYAPPETALLAQLRVAVTEAPPSLDSADAFMQAPWEALVGVARELSDAQIAAEFDALFGGVGKPEVYAFASPYLTGFMNDKPLVSLRNHLASFGLEKSDAMGETEDHIAYLFEVMRYLIAADDVAVANLKNQSEFFAQQIQPWVHKFCEMLSANPKAKFYGALADMTAALMQVEAQGFDLI